MGRNYQITCVVLVSLIAICTCDDELPPTCFSEIYCHGPLLHTVQMAKIFEDSKTFVDMKMKYSPNETMKHFENFMKNFTHGNKPSKLKVEEFVNTYFESAGNEFEDWTPSDWTPCPKFVNKIKDMQFKDWVIKLHDTWKNLGRKIKSDIKDNIELYSIIWVPNPVVVPGGRFQEYYYWDSYWIVQGLLLSEMYDTTKGMLENFLYLVDTYGHIPNGGRIYYLTRSQPPLLIPMIKLYLDATNDKDFIAKNILSMEKEFDYWITNHTKTITKCGVNYTLATYGDKSRGPRPESYSEDVESGGIFMNNRSKEAFYSQLKAAAESGWEFSSRWFISNGNNKSTWADIKTTYIVPVDLNALLCGNAKLLHEFNLLLNNTEKAEKYAKIAATWMNAVREVLWDEEVGVWLDYDIINEENRDFFYPSNISPLWTGCYDANKDEIALSVLKYLQDRNIPYPGGIPTTVEDTGEQWDFPSAWPPLQHIIIVGLNQTGNYYAGKTAYELAQRWVRSNFKAFKETGVMFEKYDATVVGGHGGDAECDVEEGFGWTNGVIMDLLSRYGNNLTMYDSPEKSIIEKLSTEEPSTFPSTRNENNPTAASSSFLVTLLILLLISPPFGFI